ncbi:phage terminase large subunit family protein [Streptomyces sp. NBC_00028]|uniref:hypothetical protein n=1 Tax=Streptomyces sp. NBC_00028 TaxID=2975624 RepID=UPI003252D882
MDSEERVCPVCGQPVETVVHRHKTLGAWVPVWVAGPCRNPDCAAYAEEGTEPDDERAKRAAGRSARKPAGQVGGESAGKNS